MIGDVQDWEQSVRARGWQPHSDPAGFAVGCPVGWTVESRPDAFMLLKSPDEGLIIAHPFQAPAQRAVDYLLRSQQLLPADLCGFTVVIPGNLHYSPNDNEVCAPIVFTCPGNRSGIGDVLCKMDGSNGMLFAIGAPSPIYLSLNALLADVLGTFMFIPPATSAAQSQTQYQQWRDPSSRHAFVIDVPVGWTVSGGTEMIRPVDTRYVIEAWSSDPPVRIAIGDRAFPTTYTEPSTIPFAGVGIMAAPGAYTEQLRNYETGHTFAARYITWLFPRASIVDSRDLPTVAGSLKEMNRNIIGETWTSAAEVSFAVDREWRGSCMAATTLHRFGGVSTWHVNQINWFLGTAATAGKAAEILAHMLGTLKFDQAALVSISAEQRTQFELANQLAVEWNQMFMSSYWRRQAAQDDFVRQTSNLLLGVVDVVNTDTGQIRKVPWGSNVYWEVGHLGDHIIGTRTTGRPYAPGIDVSRLRRV